MPTISDVELVECEICGDLMPIQKKVPNICHLCWNVEGSIIHYLRSEKGREKMKEYIKNAEDT